MSLAPPKAESSGMTAARSGAAFTGSSATVSLPEGLNGEIIAPSGGVRVVGSPHPLRVSRIEDVMPAGLSVAEIVDAVLAKRGHNGIAASIVVYIDGVAVSHEMWGRVRLKPGAVLTYVMVPEGEATRSIAMVAIAVAGLALSGGFAAPLLGATLGTGFGAAALG